MDKENIKNKFRGIYEFQKNVGIINNISELIDLYDSCTSKTSSELEQKILDDLIENYNFKKQIDIDLFIINIDDLNGISNPDEFLAMHYYLLKRTDDKAQINTLHRIRTKFNAILPIGSEFDSSNSGIKKICKVCPHCKIVRNYAYEDTNYVICGYGNKNGYDWIGCRKDWCFQCGKKLCKSWYLNKLFNTFNRYHNGICCKRYARKNSESYKNDYCHCINNHVNRNKFN